MGDSAVQDNIQILQTAGIGILQRPGKSLGPIWRNLTVNGPALKRNCRTVAVISLMSQRIATIITGLRSGVRLTQWLERPGAQPVRRSHRSSHSMNAMIDGSSGDGNVTAHGDPADTNPGLDVQMGHRPVDDERNLLCRARQDRPEVASDIAVYACSQSIQRLHTPPAVLVGIET